MLGVVVPNSIVKDPPVIFLVFLVPGVLETYHNEFVWLCVLVGRSLFSFSSGPPSIFFLLLETHRVASKRRLKHFDCNILLVRTSDFLLRTLIDFLLRTWIDSIVQGDWWLTQLLQVPLRSVHANDRGSRAVVDFLRLKTEGRVWVAGLRVVLSVVLVKYFLADGVPNRRS